MRNCCQGNLAHFMNTMNARLLFSVSSYKILEKMIRRCCYCYTASHRLLLIACFIKRRHIQIFTGRTAAACMSTIFMNAPLSAKIDPTFEKEGGRFHHYVAGHTLLNDGEGDFMSTIWYSKCLCVQWLHLNYFSRSIMFPVQTGAGCC